MTDTGSVIIPTSIIVCGNLAGGGTVESTLLFHRCPPAKQVGQLGDIGGDASGLIAAEQLGRRSTSRLVRQIDQAKGRMPLKKNPGQSTHPGSGEFSRLGFWAERQGVSGGWGLPLCPA